MLDVPPLRREYCEREFSETQDLPNIQITNLTQDLTGFSPIEQYPFGPFLNIPDFEMGDFGNTLSDPSLTSLNWGAGHISMESIG